MESKQIINGAKPKQLKSIMKKKKTKMPEIVYFVEWKQFAVTDEAPLKDQMQKVWDATPFQAVIADVETVMEGIQQSHEDKKEQIINEMKSKKKVRFQLPSSKDGMPDVVQGCNMISPNSKGHTLKRHKGVKSFALPMIKRKVKNWFNSSPLMDSVIEGKNGLEKLMSKPNSYHRLDENADGEDLLLIDAWEAEQEEDMEM